MNIEIAHTIADLFQALTLLKNKDWTKHDLEIKESTYRQLNVHCKILELEYKDDEIFNNSDFIERELKKRFPKCLKIAQLGLLYTTLYLNWSNELKDELSTAIKNSLQKFTKDEIGRIEKIVDKTKIEDYPILIHKLIDSKVFDNEDSNVLQAQPSINYNINVENVMDGGIVSGKIETLNINNETISIDKLRNEISLIKDEIENDNDLNEDDKKYNLAKIEEIEEAIIVRDESKIKQGIKKMSNVVYDVALNVGANVITTLMMH